MLLRKTNIKMIIVIWTSFTSCSLMVIKLGRSLCQTPIFRHQGGSGPWEWARGRPRQGEPEQGEPGLEAHLGLGGGEEGAAGGTPGSLEQVEQGDFLSLRLLTQSPSASSLWSMWRGFSFLQTRTSFSWMGWTWYFNPQKDKNTTKVDLVALIPYFFSIILAGLEDLDIIGKAGKIVRLLRIMRILRIFKMVRHFVGLQSLVYTLHQAKKHVDKLWFWRSQ